VRYAGLAGNCFASTPSPIRSPTTERHNRAARKVGAEKREHKC
jgi:hypothetical protein